MMMQLGVQTMLLSMHAPAAGSWAAGTITDHMRCNGWHFCGEGTPCPPETLAFQAYCPWASSGVCAGNTTFLVSADDWAAVYLQPLSNVTRSADQAFNGSHPILSTLQPCPGFFCSPDQASAPMSLAKGRQYLIEARHWQWGGSAHFALAALTPSSSPR